MTEITVSGNTREEALAEGLNQLGVPEELVEVELLDEAHDDTLPGAEPLPGVTLRLRVKEERLTDAAKQHLKTLLEHMGIECRIEVMRKPRGTILNVLAGEDGSLIIGKNGQNIDAIQYLVNRMVIKSGREISPFIIDSEGYRERRVAKIEEIARKMAKKAIRMRREVAMLPMSAAERRIVHITLREIRGIFTVSRGEEPERYVVITPAAAQRGSRMLGGDQDRGGRGERGPRTDRDRAPRGDRGYRDERGYRGDDRGNRTDRPARGDDRGNRSDRPGGGYRGPRRDQRPGAPRSGNRVEPPLNESAPARDTDFDARYETFSQGSDEE